MRPPLATFLLEGLAFHRTRRPRLTHPPCRHPSSIGDGVAELKQEGKGASHVFLPPKVRRALFSTCEETVRCTASSRNQPHPSPTHPPQTYLKFETNMEDPDGERINAYSIIMDIKVDLSRLTGPMALLQTSFPDQKGASPCRVLRPGL